jgi:hypothetical protein
MSNRSDWMNFRTHCRLVETLAHIPRMAFFLGSHLKVTTRQIKTDRVAKNQVFCGVDRDICPASPQCDDHFNLMVQVFGQRRIGHTQFTAAANHSITGFHEEERRLLTRGLIGRPHFARMLGVVAANTKNAANREKCSAAGNRQNRLGVRRKNKTHGDSFQ